MKTHDEYCKEEWARSLCSDVCIHCRSAWNVRQPEIDELKEKERFLTAELSIWHEKYGWLEKENESLIKKMGLTQQSLIKHMKDNEMLKESLKLYATLTREI